MDRLTFTSSLISAVSLDFGYAIGQLDTNYRTYGIGLRKGMDSDLIKHGGRRLESVTLYPVYQSTVAKGLRLYPPSIAG